MDLIDQYKACAINFGKIPVKTRMPLKQLDEKIYTATARRLADNLRVDALNKWNLNESTSYFIKIIDGTYQTIKHAQKSHFEQCEKQHKLLLGGINNINAYIDEIEVIGSSDVKDMIELSNAFINTINMSYTKLLSHGIDLRISPLNPYFESIIERLEDITNPKRIERAIAINNLNFNTGENTETLSSLITHTKGDFIVGRLKVDFKNIKGKGLKLLFLALQDLDLLPKDQNASVFHRCCKGEFKWNIATYVAMNKHVYNKYTDKSTFDDMKMKISNYLNTN
jgi:hypothetical protein